MSRLLTDAAPSLNPQSICKDPPMTRSAVIAKLESIVFARLFESDPWLAHRETCVAVERCLEELGLQERVCGSNNTWTNTRLGTELNLDLLSVFMGIWDEWEMPIILLDHELLDEVEVEYLQHWLQRGREPEAVLKKHVRAAYLKYYKYNPAYLN
jgi:hypothetical protein